MLNLVIFVTLVTTSPKITWTFDDGPLRTSTPHILHLLDQYGLKGKFFVLGAHQQDRRNQKWLREVVARGHTLGNHLFTHKSECKLGIKGTLRELRRTEWWVARVLKRPRRSLKWYRPPHGFRCRSVDRAVRRQGYKIMMWHISDYGSTAAKMWRKLRWRLRKGKPTILLFHHNWRRFRDFLHLAEKGGAVRRRK